MDSPPLPAHPRTPRGKRSQNAQSVDDKTRIDNNSLIKPGFTKIRNSPCNTQKLHEWSPKNVVSSPTKKKTERFLGVKLSAQGDQPTIMSHGKNTSIPLHYTGWLIGIPMIDFRNPWQTRCYDLWFNHHLSLGYDLWSPIWQKKNNMGKLNGSSCFHSLSLPPKNSEHFRYFRAFSPDKTNQPLFGTL